MAKRIPKTMPDAVKAVFKTFPGEARQQLLAVRALIHEVAAEIDGAAPLTETLKWGEPAYLTARKVGSTVRLGWKAKDPHRVGLYFICTTRLVDDFRSQFDGTLSFDGNRAILLPVNEPLPVEVLKSCLAAALSYHQK